MPVTDSSRVLTPRQQHWLEHLRACEARGCSLKDYAGEHGLSVQAAYVAKSELKRRGAWPVGEAPASSLTLVPVSMSAPARCERAVVRLSLPNGVRVEVLDSMPPEQLGALMHAMIGERS